jgi:hypothetical protein
MHGRGATWNPQNRFETLEYIRDEEAPPDDTSPHTTYLRDPTRTIIATNDSPDIGFEASINPYRGCEHGCIYCFARPNTSSSASPPASTSRRRSWSKRTRRRCCGRS